MYWSVLVPVGARAWAWAAPRWPCRAANGSWAGDRPLPRRWPASAALGVPAPPVRACAPGRGHVGEQRFGEPADPGMGGEPPLAVVGPHEYSATLSYAMLALGGGGCLGHADGTLGASRVDAIVLWEPSRPTDEVAPLRRHSRAQRLQRRVSGHHAAGSHLHRQPRAGAEPRAVGQFDSLRLGPGASCHEDAVVYELAVKPPSGQGGVPGHGPAVRGSGRRERGRAAAPLAGRPGLCALGPGAPLCAGEGHRHPLGRGGLRTAMTATAQGSGGAPAKGVSRRALSRRAEPSPNGGSAPVFRAPGTV